MNMRLVGFSQKSYGLWSVTEDILLDEFFQTNITCSEFGGGSLGQRHQHCEKELRDCACLTPRRDSFGDQAASCLETPPSGARQGNEHRELREQQGPPAPKRRVTWEVRLAPVQAMPSPMGHSPTGSDTAIRARFFQQDPPATTASDEPHSGSLHGVQPGAKRDRDRARGKSATPAQSGTDCVTKSELKCSSQIHEKECG
ncbi:hypothetical protein WISP_56487 [Willisornis vidua]|uniref:Uncharacterized protein n=1 Tax=Willisornis vidua TaxID=1566151 RepID=A0ABQ9DHS2_9PASS|nr:hypothetical protein WISP_56487 [Willisornis vidua]